MIELLVVIVIMAVMAAIAIPAFVVWLPNYRLKSAARDLYSNFQLTKLGAIKQNKSWAIVFDQTVDPGEYRIVSDWGGANSVEKTVSFVQYEGVDFGNGNVNITATTPPAAYPAGDDIHYGVNDAVVFNSRGTCNGGYVYLDNKKNTTYGVGTMTSGVILLRKWSGTAWK